MDTAFFRRQRCIVSPLRAFCGLVLLYIFANSLLSAATTYYVAPDGKDSNQGSSGSPFRTIQKAADIVNPGDIVIIRDGVYTGDSTVVAIIRRSGAAGQWITFKAENEWGALIDGRNNTSRHGIDLDDGVGYVRIEGLRIQGTISGGFSAKENTHDIVYYRNLLHNIGRNCTDTAGGQVGFRDEGSSTRFVYDSNVLHTIGRLRPNEGCTNLSTNNYANHDHGMYLSGSHVTIVNNVFYNLRSGWGIQSAQGAKDWLIANNTFAFPNPDRDGHIVLWQSNSSFTIANNIFYEPRGAAIELNPCSSKTNIVVRNNVSTAPRMLAGGSCRGVTLTNNDTSTDPRLVDPEEGSFQLSATSPAIDIADVSVSALLDHNGTPRPQGGGFDVGAFEFIDPLTVPPMVSISSPAPGANVSGDIVISAKVSDTDLAAVRFQVNGEDIGPEGATSEHSVTWNVDDLPNGLALITAIARDAAGNLGTTSLIVTVNHPSSPGEPSPPDSQSVPRVRGRR
jgi:hypothetical protein